MLAPPAEVDEITPGLWVSGMPEAHWDLAKWGVSIVVSLSEHLPPQAARRYEWATSGGAHGDGRVVYLHWPFEDGPLPDAELAAHVAACVATAVRGGLIVLVHCQEGRNRSGLIVGLALRDLTGCSGADACAIVRARRPGMLSNRTFASALEALSAVAQATPATAGPHVCAAERHQHGQRMSADQDFPMPSPTRDELDAAWGPNRPPDDRVRAAAEGLVGHFGVEHYDPTPPSLLSKALLHATVDAAVALHAADNATT